MSACNVGLIRVSIVLPLGDEGHRHRRLRGRAPHRHLAAPHAAPAPQARDVPGARQAQARGVWAALPNY